MHKVTHEVSNCDKMTTSMKEATDERKGAKELPPIHWEKFELSLVEASLQYI